MENTRAHAAAIAGIRTIRTLSSGAGFQSFSRLVIASTFAAFPAVARASLLSPELEDMMAEIVSWAALIVAPIARLPLERLSLAVLPFLALEFAVLFVIATVPELTLTLPRSAGYVK